MQESLNEISWYEAFHKSLNPVFTKKDFDNYLNMVKGYMPIYKRFLKRGGKILDVGCGLGCTAIPLSILKYNVTGIDNDNKVVDCARENAKKFGRAVRIIYGNIFDLKKMFRKDSFDACISGGVLEHFPKKDIIKLLKKQLFVAPIVVSAVPIFKRNNPKKAFKDPKNQICPDGIYRNLWTKTFWLKNIFKDFNVIYSKSQKAPDLIGGFNELIVVIERSPQPL